MTVSIEHVPEPGTAVTVCHAGPLGEYLHLGRLSATQQVGDCDHTLWLDMPGAAWPQMDDIGTHTKLQPVPCDGYPIDLARVISISPTRQEAERERKADEVAAGIERLAVLVRQHPELAHHQYSLVAPTVFGLENDHPLRADADEEDRIDLGGGVTLHLYRSSETVDA